MALNTRLVRTRAAGSARVTVPVARAQSRRLAVQVRADKCLIVNTKGGGHAFIGLYLAKELLRRGHDVTIFNDGDPVGIVASFRGCCSRTGRTRLPGKPG
jgi:hypothetical protein